MGARESTIVGGSLLAMCFLMSGAARATEPEQPGALVPTSPAPALPAFLDDERLPAMEEAWRAREQAPQTEAPKGAAPIELPAASSAKQGAGQASRDSASVRQRAEELSRRFGAEGATAEPPVAGEAPTSVTIPPAVVPKTPVAQHKQAVVKPALPARKGAAAAGAKAVNAPSPAAPDATPTAQSALIGEKLRLAAPPPPSEDIPPLPVRSPKGSTKASAAGAAPPGPRNYGAITRARPAHDGASKAAPPTSKEDLRGTILTNELGAFGWNSKPD